MLKLKNRDLGLAGGFKYTQKESGVLFKCSSWDQLIVQLKKHRVANGYDIPLNWEDEVEDQLCKNCPDPKNWCVENNNPQPTHRKLGVGDVVMFTRVLVDKLLRGGKNVDADEATRRASICASCKDNVTISGCRGCNSGRIEQVVRRVTDSGTTKYDDKLETCKFCGCFNKAQIWFPLDLLKKNMSEEIKESLPSHCWKK